MRKKNGKKLLVFAFCICVLTACGKNGEESVEVSQKVTEEAELTDIGEQAEMEKETNMESLTSTETTWNASETKETVEEETFIADRSEVFEMLKTLGAGWNLGNTFDAHGQKHSLADETYWGNPETSKEMMHALKEQGFGTIRIPVTWADHVSEAPEYLIDEEWLNRVQEVVDWALEEDLYVILDTHHEPDYWLKPQEDGLEEVEKELYAIWTQIANRFAEYPDQLIFEGMNEPRMKGTQEEWSGGTKEGRACVNALNQTFLDAVRATGGQNENRLCIICTYGNSVSYNTITELTIPKDNHIAVAVHLYTPYFFTYDVDSDQNVEIWDGSMKADIISNMQLVSKNLIEKDVPVIITEYGAEAEMITDENGQRVENATEVMNWLVDYLETSNRYGMPAVWWDNNIYQKRGEQFGLFDRENLSWYRPEISDYITAHPYTGEQRGSKELRKGYTWKKRKFIGIYLVFVIFVC